MEAPFVSLKVSGGALTLHRKYYGRPPILLTKVLAMRHCTRPFVVDYDNGAAEMMIMLAIQGGPVAKWTAKLRP